MAQYNSIQDYVDAKLKQISDQQMEKAFLFSVMSTIGKMGIRIFDKGLASNGSGIGKYSERGAMYIGNKNSPRAGTLRGKTGKNKFRSGKLHKTTYYESYKSFRQKMGRKTDKVNLVLTGQLQRNFLSSTIVKAGKLGYDMKLREDNMKKARGSEAHFGKKIFDLTRAERDELRKIYKFEVIKLLKK